MGFHCSSNNTIPFFTTVAENLPIHMSDNEVEIVDNELDVKFSKNKEEIEYKSASETSLDTDFDEEDNKFQAPLIVPP